VYFLQPAGRDEAGCRQLHLARHHQGAGPRRRRAEAEAKPSGNRPARTAVGRSAGDLHAHLNAQALVGRSTLDRARARDRAGQPDVVPRRKNNPLLVARRASARPRSPKAWRAHRRGQVPRISRAARSTRSTWARSSQAPSTGGGDFEQRLKAVLKQLVDNPCDTVHRRDPHADRRRRGLTAGRWTRRPTEARALDRRAQVHRRDHLQRVPRRVEKITRFRDASRRSTCPNPRSTETVAILRGPEVALEAHHRHQVQRPTR